WQDHEDWQPPGHVDQRNQRLSVIDDWNHREESQNAADRATEQGLSEDDARHERLGRSQGFQRRVLLNVLHGVRVNGLRDNNQPDQKTQDRGGQDRAASSRFYRPIHSRLVSKLIPGEYVDLREPFLQALFNIGNRRALADSQYDVHGVVGPETEIPDGVAIGSKQERNAKERAITLDLALDARTVTINLDFCRQNRHRNQVPVADVVENRVRRYFSGEFGHVGYREALSHIRVRSDQGNDLRSEEHTSELQSRFDFVCRLLLDQKQHFFSGLHHSAQSLY